MVQLNLCKLTRFFPYESVHASNSPVAIHDDNKEWYHAIVDLLSRYLPDEYINCSKGYFHLSIDNKITLELDNNLYITYWDNIVYISAQYHTIKYAVNDQPMCCTVIRK